ncbi:hypothetical protein, partial [Corallococcus carmarthensis]
MSLDDGNPAEFDVFVGLSSFVQATSHPVKDGPDGGAEAAGGPEGHHLHDLGLLFAQGPDVEVGGERLG